MSGPSSTRRLRPWIKRELEAMATDGPQMFSKRGLRIKYLVNLGFVEQDGDATGDMRPFMITERGRVALEREKRGVDPYISMVGEAA